MIAQPMPQRTTIPVQMACRFRALRELVQISPTEAVYRFRTWTPMDGSFGQVPAGLVSRILSVGLSANLAESDFVDAITVPGSLQLLGLNEAPILARPFQFCSYGQTAHLEYMDPIQNFDLLGVISLELDAGLPSLVGMDSITIQATISTQQCTQSDWAEAFRRGDF